MAPCWEGLQISWKTELVFKTALIICEGLGKKSYSKKDMQNTTVTYEKSAIQM